MGACYSKGIKSNQEAILAKIVDCHYDGNQTSLTRSFAQFFKTSGSKPLLTANPSSLSVNAIECEKVTNGLIPLDTYLKERVVKGDPEWRPILRFAKAVYPLFSSNADMYEQGKALFQLFAADEGSFSLKSVILAVASLSIHGTSFVKVPMRFVDFFIEESISKDVYDIDAKTHRTADIHMKDAETFSEWFGRAYAFQKIATSFLQRIFTFPPDQVFANTEENRKRFFARPTVKGHALKLVGPEDLWFLQYQLSGSPAIRSDALEVEYTTRYDGRSWNIFSSRLRTWQGNKVVLMKDTEGHIFGAYTEVDMFCSPEFHGNDKGAVFTLQPKMAWYRPTGMNGNYQYLQQGTQTLPNGLGFGGQVDYFGLFLNQDFLRGQSMADPMSSTYGNPRLSGKAEFELEDLEMVRVWSAKAELKQKMLLQGRRGTVDVRRGDLAEDRAFMEMAGRTMYSAEDRRNRNTL